MTAAVIVLALVVAGLATALVLQVRRGDKRTDNATDEGIARAALEAEVEIKKFELRTIHDTLAANEARLDAAEGKAFDAVQDAAPDDLAPGDVHGRLLRYHARTGVAGAARPGAAAPLPAPPAAGGSGPAGPD